MADHVSGPAKGDDSNGQIAARSARSAPWDPHEVWLNRVKRPRELAGYIDAGYSVNVVNACAGRTAARPGARQPADQSPASMSMKTRSSTSRSAQTLLASARIVTAVSNASGAAARSAAACRNTIT